MNGFSRDDDGDCDDDDVEAPRVPGARTRPPRPQCADPPETAAAAKESAAAAAVQPSRPSERPPSAAPGGDGAFGGGGKRGCHLRWSRLIKTVEIREASTGLLGRGHIGAPRRGKEKTKYSSSPSPPRRLGRKDEEGGEEVTHKVILNEVSGEARPGEVLALMGPSGSGKTSLLDALSGRSTYSSGTFTMDGRIVEGSTKKSLKRKIAYIKQADVFFDHLTVRDQLTYTALLRLPSSLTKDAKHAEVDRILDTLRLGKCADTPIMMVSGGEKKRVNIGTELLTDPSVVMLDEPTSGLDSTSAVALLKILTDLARTHGKTVVTSIHQPSSAVFQSFDRLLLLADGCAVFLGHPRRSLEYLRDLGYECPPGYNAADHWMDLLVVDSALDGGGTVHGGIAAGPTAAGRNIRGGGSGGSGDGGGASEDGSGDDVFLDDDGGGGDAGGDWRRKSSGGGAAAAATALAAERAVSASTDDAADGDGATAHGEGERRGGGGGLQRRLSHALDKRRSALLTRRRSSAVDLARAHRVRAGGGAGSKSALVAAWDNNAVADEMDEAAAADNERRRRDGMESERNSAPAHEAAADGEGDGRGRGGRSKFNTSWPTQFRVLTHRCMKNSRSAIFTPLNLIKSFALGIMTGLLWFRMPYTERTVVDRSSYFFFTMTYWVFDAMFNALFSFPAERQVIFKERASGSYHLSAYFMAKTTSEAPARLTLPSIYMLISYWMAGINPSFRVFLGSAACCLMSVMAGESMGLLVGATVMDFERAMVIMVVFSLTLMLGGGYYVDNIPVFLVWLPYMSPFKYAYNGSQRLVFDRPVPCDGSGVLEVICGAAGNPGYATAEQVKEFLNVEGSLGFNMGLLLVIFAVPRYLAYLCLRRKKGGERTG